MGGLKAPYPHSMFLLLSIILIVCSVIYWPKPVNDSFWIIKETVFVLGSLIMFSYSLYLGRNYINFKNKILAVFLLYVSLEFIWFFYSSFITASGKVSWNFWNFRPTINVLCGVLLIKILYEYAKSLKDWIGISKTIAWLGGIFATYSLFQYFGIDPVFNKGTKILYTNNVPNGEDRMFTFFGTGFITSAFLAVCAPMCLIFKGLRYKVLYGVICIALILLNKTMALAALVTGLSVYLFLNKSWMKLLLLGLCALGGLVFCVIKNPLFFAFTGRLSVWEDVWELFLKKPFFGYGLGYFEMLQLKINGFLHGATRNVTFAHNEYLHNLIDLGMVGSAAYLAFIGDVFRRVFHSDKNIIVIGYTAGLVSFLVLCMGSFPLRIAPVALIAIIYIAGLLSICKGDHNV